jgi:4-hydroxyphenylpyruvate dioxygenase
MTEIVMPGETAEAVADEDPLAVLGIPYVEFWVGNARLVAQYFRGLGFTVSWYRGLETGSTETASWVVSCADVNLMFTSALDPGHEVAEFVRQHGDAVRDVALQVPDAIAAHTQAIRRGALDAGEPAIFRSELGETSVASIQMLGSSIHSLISSRGDGLLFEALGFACRAANVATGPISGIDHIALAIRDGRLQETIDFYHDVFGFAEMDLASLANVTTDYSALMSKVIEGGGGKVKFPIIEAVPGPRRSQIEEFLDFHNDEGVQHLAFLTEDIVAAAARFADGGLRSLSIPRDYYAEIAARVPEISASVGAFADYSILADRDEDGYLLQMFTETIHDRPTIFLELIERHGSQGFGARNVRSLFEAVERAQVARGTV